MEATPSNRWNEGRFGVQGFVEFSVMNDGLLDGEDLRRRIEDADKTHPWVSYYVGGKPAPSIGWMSDATMHEPVLGALDRRYRIEIRPSFHLEATQFYPYHRYLCDLAMALATTDIPGVHTVTTRMTIEGGGSNHMTPTAQARFDAHMASLSSE